MTTEPTQLPDDPTEPTDRDMTEVLADLLSLVMEDPPSEEVVAKWGDDQRWYAERWAAAEYMSASDNPVMRYCAPLFLGIGQHVTPHRGCILR